MVVAAVERDNMAIRVTVRADEMNRSVHPLTNLKAFGSKSITKTDRLPIECLLLSQQLFGVVFRGCLRASELMHCISACSERPCVTKPDRSFHLLLEEVLFAGSTQPLF